MSSGGAGATPPDAPRGGVIGALGRWRMPIVWTLVGLALVLVVASSLTVWVKRQALDTEAWTEASAQVLEDEETRAAIATYLVNQVFTGERIPAIQEQLPPQLAPLAPTLAVALEDLAQRTTERLLATDRVQDLWRRANETAHEQLLAILDGETVGPIVAGDGELILDLSPLLERVRARIGIEQPLDEDAGKVVIMSSENLKAAQTGVRVVRVVSVLSVGVVLLLLVAAVWLGEGRRREVILVTGVGLVVAGLLLAVVRRLAGQYVVDALVDNPTSEVPASNVWLIGTSLLRDVAAALVLYGVVVAVGAWLAGPARPAVAVRRRVAPAVANVWVVYAVVAVVLLLLMSLSPTSDDRTLLGSLVLLALLVAGVEVLRRRILSEFPRPPAAA